MLRRSGEFNRSPVGQLDYKKWRDHYQSVMEDVDRKEMSKLVVVHLQ